MSTPAGRRTVNPLFEAYKVRTGQQKITDLPAAIQPAVRAVLRKGGDSKLRKFANTSRTGGHKAVRIGAKLRRAHAG